MARKRTPMDLNPLQILAALVGSALGYVYFSYGGWIPKMC